MSFSYSGGSGQFQKRVLSIKFSYAAVTENTGNTTQQAGVLGNQPTNDLTVSGVRASVAIQNVGGISQGTCDLRVYGMTETHMAKLTLRGGYVTAASGNVVEISAGLLGSPLSVIYTGNINRACPDYSASPDVWFQVASVANLVQAIAATPPVSYQGTTDVATAMSGLAKSIGATFENNGVTTQISSPYLWGSPLSQIRQLAEMANINHVLDNSKSPPTLSIWPGGGARSGQTIQISPQTGLIGYPTLLPQGVECTVLFNPAIKIGGMVEILSSVPQASGTYQVIGMAHTLESEMPGGAWFTHLVTNDAGLLPVSS